MNIHKLKHIHKHTRTHPNTIRMNVHKCSVRPGSIACRFIKKSQNMLPDASFLNA